MDRRDTSALSALVVVVPFAISLADAERKENEYQNARTE